MTDPFITKETPVDDAALNVIAHLPTEHLLKLADPAFFRKLKDRDFMRIATLLAQKSYDEGGCPIGGVIVDNVTHQIIGKGHNTLAQENDSTTHGETAALRDAGRVAKLSGKGPVDFRNTTLFTTLTPCVVCCAQITNRCNCQTVVIGDVTNAPSTEKLLRDGGIQNVVILEDPKAVALYKDYAEKRPDLHFIDWAGHKKWEEARSSVPPVPSPAEPRDAGEGTGGTLKWESTPDRRYTVCSMDDRADIAIVGGGAAGLAAAIFAAEAVLEAVLPRRIVVLDGARSLGAKILVSGGGRCNVTHDSASPEDFNGSRPVVRNVLAAFPPAAAVQWFASMGVELKREETGKLFPAANSARAVLNALLNRCGQLGVTLQTSSRVTAVTSTAWACAGEGQTVESADATRSQGGYFTIEHALGTTRCARLILATGGRSLPRSGSDGTGWEIVKRLGHTVTPTYAALVPLVLDPAMFHAGLAGIAMEVELSTFVEGKRADRRRGSLLWTHFGISGPVVMDASRHWVTARESGAAAVMQCNLLPPDDFVAAERWLIELAASRPRAVLINAVAARLPERVAAVLVAHAGIDSATTCGNLNRPARRTLAHALTALPLRVLHHRGWNFAEVTAGGVPLNEIDYRTMESRKVSALHLVGEILDCDGRIGGFNFQWAWATGYLAGRAAGQV